MLRKSLALSVVLMLFVACRDGPTTISATDDEVWNRPNNNASALHPIIVVGELMNDRFVKPLDEYSVYARAVPRFNLPLGLLSAVRGSRERSG